MKTLIAVPCMDNVPFRFFRSYTFMQPVGECMNGFTEATLVYDARNKLAEQAIDGDYDYVFWLDSDMVFEPDLMQRMFDSIGDKDFLTGLYFTRRNQPKPCIFDICRAGVKDGDVIPSVRNYWEYPVNSTFEIEACGFGCVLMKTKMLRDVWEHMGLPFNPTFGFGEDLSFCMRARQLGYTLWCDSRIKLGHTMITESNEDIYLLQRSLTIGRGGDNRAGSVAPSRPDKEKANG